ncbi:MAG: bifunctional folylpolyglutamate synthase/dihydrofolate synthase [Acidobacteriota bacterium]|nr:bifunctional folylpolyglutamate synthase/dihydrofolate synthase [Acidobacteriota bacterium]
MNFQESIKYLFGLGYELSVKKFGLENTYTLLNALGNPQKNFIKVQVAGTNGKGSTCKFLESILVQAGIKVGLNTSPHLVSVTERIRVNGIDILEEKFAEYVTKVRKISEELVKSGELNGMPTFFEHITCIAQMVFADENVEIAILETGLGGRFDATTATEAEIVAITPIDLDHIKTLGDTIEKIAIEKASIIREGVKAVIAEQKYEAMRIILSKCVEKKVSPNVANLVEVENLDNLVTFKTNKNIYREIKLGLLGRHQIENSTTAILLAETLSNFKFQISNKDIENGLQRAKHKGRLEYSDDGILYDGAHNVAGAKVLREYLLESNDKPLIMIFGAMGGKNLDEISKILFPLAEQIIFTTPENPRAMPAKEIAEFVSQEFDKNKIFVIDEIPQAFEKAREISGENNLILVTGSLYLIGEIQAYLKNQKVERRKKKK